MSDGMHARDGTYERGHAALPARWGAVAELSAEPADPRAASRGASGKSFAGADPGAGVDTRSERRMNTIKRILIVDDSPTERHVLNDMLTRAGFEVVATDNGEDAIVKARLVKPDLILMDVVMPGLNGFQATRAISRDPETRGIPIIMCTSKSQDTDKIWGMRQGARDYVVKPVRRDELLAKIATLD
jgi:twitching motility two-component system response regulator PilH